MGFTGVDDPYEARSTRSHPRHQQAVRRTCVDAIIEKLIAMGYILPHGHIAV